MAERKIVMLRGKWNGFFYEYPNGVRSSYRIEIKEIIAYKFDGKTYYRIEYHDGAVEDKSEEFFTDGEFINEMRKLGKFEHHKTHNGEFTIYRGYEYDYRLEA